MTNQPQEPIRVTLSEWDIRRLYNEGDIKRLAAQGRFDVKTKYGTPKGRTSRIPAGSRSVKTRYFEKSTGIQIASFHHYQSPEGKTIGRFDPKFLLISGIEYHPRGEGKPEPPRIGNKKINEILGKSGFRAAATYFYHCAEQSKKLWKEQVRARLVRLGVLETREWVLV